MAGCNIERESIVIIIIIIIIMSQGVCLAGFVT